MAFLVVVCGAVAAISFLLLAWMMESLRFWAITVLALTYPIGKSLQTLVAGPAWIRHYLSDFGFVPFMVLAWVVALRLLMPRSGPTDFSAVGALPAAIFFLGISLLGEAVQWIMGTADWLDVACEIFGAILTVALLRNIESFRWDRLGR
jgi:hypothetical protein